MRAEEPSIKWEVDTGSSVYSGSFDELTQWICEGAVLPADKVRKGNLRWIEAGKVPTLIPFFNGTAKPNITVTESIAPENDAVPTESFFENQKPEQFAVPTTNACSLHAEVEPFFQCESCNSLFCKACPKAFGATVRICPFCGASCKPIREVSAAAVYTQRNRAATGKFGFGDFGDALGYPGKFPASVIGLGLIAGILSVAGGAVGIGSAFLAGAGLICMMLGNALKFSVISGMVERMVQGDYSSDIMPKFNNFNIWDDLVVPTALSVAALVVSFGLFFAIAAGTLWYVGTAIQDAVPNAGATATNTITGPGYGDPNSVKQVDMFKDFSADINELKSRQDPDKFREQAASNTAPAYDEEAEFIKLDQDIKRLRADQMKAQTGGLDNEPAFDFAKMFSALKKIVPLMLLGFVALLWGLFYYPAALTVAAYTQSVGATLNPATGFDTIRRLGFDYVKLIVMTAFLSIIASFIVGFVAAIASPLTIPKFGNIPATFVSGFLSVWVAASFAYLVGSAIYKAGDRLQLFRTQN